MSLDLDHELETLDHQTALQFKKAVMAMLQLVKAKQVDRPQAPFAERIARHPAIGTWPTNIDVDGHISNLREEWDR